MFTIVNLNDENYPITIVTELLLSVDDVILICLLACIYGEHNKLIRTAPFIYIIVEHYSNELRRTPITRIFTDHDEKLSCWKACLYSSYSFLPRALVQSKRHASGKKKPQHMSKVLSPGEEKKQGNG